MKNLSKKLFAVTLALVLTLATGMAVMAAPSPVSGVTSATPGVTVSACSVAAPTVSSVADILTAAGLNTATTSIYAFDLTGTLTNGSVTVNVPGVTTSSKVAALRYVNGAWTKEAATAGNGTVTITGLTSLSPFAIAVDNGTKSSASTSTSSSSSTTTSAKTGESMMVTVVAALAMVAAFGACVTFRRKRA